MKADADMPRVISDLASIASGPVTVDLSGVDYLTSAELTVLVNLRRRLPNERIVLVSPRPLADRVLRIVGFNKIFEIQAAA